MEFHQGGVGCVLQGLKKGPNVSLEEGESFKLSKQERKRVLLQLIGDSAKSLEVQKQGSTKKDQQELPRPLVEILKVYEDVFKEPKGLPLIRAHDHSIPLQDGVKPVLVRPYRYHFYQKEKKLRR
jgi:hypothetical protein